MLNKISRITLVGSLCCLLFGCITPPPEPVIEEAVPAAVPEVPPLEKLTAILDDQSFVTAMTDRGLVIYLPSLYFKIDSANLALEAQARIQSISEVVGRPEFIDLLIAVEGHTDSLGDAENNMELSRRRAEAVADHLVFSNISTDRIEIAWFGETAPLEPNRNVDGSDNSENRAKNRRVEFIIMRSGS